MNNLLQKALQDLYSRYMFQHGKVHAEEGSYTTSIYTYTLAILELGFFDVLLIILRRSNVGSGKWVVG